MKKGFVALLLSVLVFGLVACNQSPNADSASSSAPSPDDILQIDFDMEVYKNQFVAWDTDPAQSEEEFKTWAEAEGFFNMTEREDGYVVFSIKRADYDAFMSELKETCIQRFEWHVTVEGMYYSVKDVSYNEDLTAITITVDREIYEKNSLTEDAVVVTCSKNAWLYQQLRADADGQYAIEVKDAATGEVFQSLTYPDNHIKEIVEIGG